MSEKAEVTELVGYVEAWSVVPGDKVRAFVSTDAARYTAELVRVIHGDTNPAGPGLKIEAVASGFFGTFPGKLQRIHAGSYVKVPTAPVLDQLGAFTIATRVWPTTPASGRQGLISRRIADGHTGFGLFINERGALEFLVETESRAPLRIGTGRPLLPKQWQFVAAAFEPASGKALIYCAPEYFSPVEQAEVVARGDLNGDAFVPPAGAPLIMAAGGLERDGNQEFAINPFNGKLEGPLLFNRMLQPDELARLKAEGALPFEETLVAQWNFGQHVEGREVVDRSVNMLNGVAVNRPARAVTGCNWSGQSDDPTQVPLEYNAIHFHDDDLEDARWEASFEFAVPSGARSGVYAVRLLANKQERLLTFFVRPPTEAPTAKVAVLMPTLTYLAYQNKASVNHIYSGGLAPRANALLQVDDYDYIRRNKLTSTYNSHSDGSAVLYAPVRCPNLTSMNPVHRYPLFDGPHCLGADLHLIDWLEAKGIAYDVITDHDLHRKGHAALKPYRAVLSGSHPEYWTRAMLDGLEAYETAGGRFMYLGGDGCQFVTAISDDGSIAEIRRGSWASGIDAGNGRLSLTGEPGGLWRTRGRPPNRVLGVSSAAQGFDRGSAYRRLPGGADPRAQFVFRGVDEEFIGDFPVLVMGYGAAGYEIDRADAGLGTPPHTLILATSVGFSDNYQRFVEEVQAITPYEGGTRSPFVRADMVFFETPNDGAVFSVGSISWCTGLSYNAYDNTVSRVTENVLRAFMVDGPWLGHERHGTQSSSRSMSLAIS